MRFLAIDPSTTVMGLVVFSNGRPVKVQTVKQKGPTLDRINEMVHAVVEVLYANPTILAIACESWGGPRNPTGQTLIKALKDVALGSSKTWHMYPPKKVTKAVAPRGWPTGTSEQMKWAMYHGVRGMFPEVIGMYRVQDEYDATAVGVAHLNKLAEQELEGGTTTQ